MYKLLVHDEEDIPGHIAYGIYKRHKIEEIARLTIENGRPPTDEELKSFIKSAESDIQIRLYTEQAAKIASNFLISSLARDVYEIKTTLKDEYDAKINKLLEDLRPKSFWYGVWQGVAASFIFVAGGILLLFATGGWERIGQALIELAK